MIRNGLFAGAAALLLTGVVGGVARAESPDMHVMTVQLPDGSVQQIQYTGNVSPRVVFVPAVAQAVDSPFALMQRMAADMDRQMALMMRQMAQPFPVGMVAGQGADGVCVHSVQMTFNAGQAPHVVSQSSGHCGEGAPGAPAATPAVQPSVPNMKPSAPTIEVKDQHPVEAPSYRGLVPSPSEWRG